jgi:hypothetical protein
LLSLIAVAGHDATYFSSKDARWKTALDGSADFIAVAGGDGTAEEVAAASVGRDTNRRAAAWDGEQPLESAWAGEFVPVNEHHRRDLAERRGTAG